MRAWKGDEDVASRFIFSMICLAEAMLFTFDPGAPELRISLPLNGCARKNIMYTETLSWIVDIAQWPPSFPDFDTFFAIDRLYFFFEQCWGGVISLALYSSRFLCEFRSRACWRYPWVMAISRLPLEREQFTIYVEHVCFSAL